jgi:hypothetical protein
MTTTLRSIAADLLAGKLPKAAEPDLARARLAECERCPNWRPVARQCAACLCFMDLKTKILTATCPVGRW